MTDTGNVLGPFVPRGVRTAKRAGQFTVVMPSQWTDGDDFGAAFAASRAVA